MDRARSSSSALIVGVLLGGVGLLTGPVAKPPGPYAVLRAWIPAYRSACGETSAGHLSYNYPIKPFRSQHPIRGNFGDPRTIVSEGGLGADTPRSPGSFTFHNGIDISAATGTPVYPVVSGSATIGYADEVIVATNDGRVFQYFHIRPEIHRGERVIAYRTVLGRVLPRVLHVHLSEIDGFRAQNPVAPGHLEPYVDHTVPGVGDVFYDDADAAPLDRRQLHGRVLISAAASDDPPLPVPAPWFDFPVTPALVWWRLTTTTGAVVVPETVVADFRQSEPPNRLFWYVYAAGTYQNFPVFGNLYFFGHRGRYLFNLTPNGLDTRKLHDGNYILSVHVADVCGNRGLLAERITIRNRH
jgi:hypothetical protein